MSMFERFQRCEATVVARHIRTSTAGLEPDYDVVVDVVTPDTATVRVTVHERRADGFRSPQVGEVVGVLFEAASQRADFDREDPRLARVAGHQASTAAYAIVGSANGTSGTLPPVPTGFGDGLYASSTSESDEPFFGGTPEVLASMHTPPGGIAADPGERLAKLQALKEQGLVSEDEYRVQRQRLIDTI
jgi:hypothetical protein